VQRILFLGILVIVLLSSCDKFENKVEVPSYVQIDSVIFQTNPSSQGVNHHKFSDIWFNLDGSQVGVFELPAAFPVIAEGLKPVAIKAGYIKSGVSIYREVHPFIEWVKDTFNFVKADTIHYTPIFKYNDLTKFWIEDFDEPGLKLHTKDSTKYLQQTIDPNQPNNQIGLVQLPDSVSGSIYYTKANFELNYTPILMELEYLNDAPFGIGIILHKANSSDEYIDPFTIIYTKEEWNLMYVNLAEQFANYTSADSYDVYFFFTTQNNVTSNTKLDNLKILYY